ELSNLSSSNTRTFVLSSAYHSEPSHRLVLRSTSGANREALPMLRKTRAVHLRILWHCRPSGTGLRVVSPIAPRPRASSPAKQMHVSDDGDGHGWELIL